MRTAATLALATALAAAATACNKSESSGPEPAPVAPMTEAEYERGVTACKAYAEHVCACASSPPDNAAWADACDLAPGRVEALERLYAVNRGESSDRERLITHDKARKMIAACIQDDNRLRAEGCATSVQLPD